MLCTNTRHFRDICMRLLTLSMLAWTTRLASAQVILQYGFDFNSGTVDSQGGSVNDDSGSFNLGQIYVGNGGAYIADIPANTQFATGIGSLDVSGDNSIATDPTGQTDAGTGLLTNTGAFLDFTAISNAGGLTVETWVKGVSTGGVDPRGQIVSVGSVYGLLVDDASRIRAYNGFDVANSPGFAFLANDWTHLAAVYSNPVVDGGSMTVDIALFINGTLADSIENSVIAQDLNRGASVGRNPAVGNLPELVDGQVYEPRISLGALAPSSFTIANPVPLPIVPTLEINRATGAMTLVGGDSDFDVLGYFIESPAAGALNAGEWTTVTNNYDVNGTSSVDDQDAWEVLSDAQDRTVLSEQEAAGGDGGGLIDMNTTIGLGTPWIQSPFEDIVATLVLSGGQSFALPVTYVGNSGQPIQVGDLNFDGSINRDDWSIYRAGIREDLTGVSDAEAYQMGDLNGDGVNNSLDFLIFREAILAANPGLTLSSLLESATDVPEPSSLLLLALGVGLMGSNMSRKASIERQSS